MPWSWLPASYPVSTIAVDLLAIINVVFASKTAEVFCWCVQISLLGLGVATNY